MNPAQLARALAPPPPPRAHRMATVVSTSPLVVRFGADASGDVEGVPYLSSYTPTVDDVVLVAVLEGGGICVQGAITT